MQVHRESLKPSELTDELQKVEKLVAGGLCDVYVLMTNAGISGAQAARIKEMLLAAGVKQVVILGSTWIG